MLTLAFDVFLVLAVLWIAIEQWCDWRREQFERRLTRPDVLPLAKLFFFHNPLKRVK
jgi:hypothetical protein